MRAVAALEDGKGEKTAVDFASLAGVEGEHYMSDPLRGYKIWRTVCLPSVWDLGIGCLHLWLLFYDIEY
jgi:hypothetical protein